MSLLLLSGNKKVEKLCLSLPASLSEAKIVSGDLMWFLPGRKINKDVDRIVLIDSDAALLVIGKGIRIFIVSKMQT